MITIHLHRRFIKSYKKLPDNLKLAFKERRTLFLENDKNGLLKIHNLHGKYAGYQSFSVTGDIRVIFKEIEQQIFIFTDIGSHSELYS